MFHWAIDFIERGGYFAIALLMFVENVFPPIPSELIMPVAGFAASNGTLNFAGVVLAGASGSLAGAMLWYFVGRWLSFSRVQRFTIRHGRWLTLSPRELEAAIGMFRRHCGKSVLFGRLIPAVRTLISLPAGLAEMAFGKFLAYSALGTLVWSGGLAFLGYLLGHEYDKVADWLDPISNVVLAILLLWYVYRVVTFKPSQ